MDGITRKYITFAILVAALAPRIGGAASHPLCPGAPSVACEQELTAQEEKLFNDRDLDPATVRAGRMQLLAERAAVREALFDVAGATADHIAVARLLESDESALIHWDKAGTWAVAAHQWQHLIDIGREVLAAWGKNRSGHAVAIVGDALWRQQEAHGRLGQAAQQIQVLELLITRTTIASSAQTFAAYNTLGRLLMTRGDRPAAEKVWRRTVAAFAKGGYAKNGGPQATAAAEAGFELLQPRFDAFLRMWVVADPKRPFPVQYEELQGQYERIVEAMEGPLTPAYRAAVARAEAKAQRASGRSVAGPFRSLAWPAEMRAGGLADAYRDHVAALGAVEWMVTAATYRARIWRHFVKVHFQAPRACDFADEDSYHCGAFVDKTVGVVERRALADLDAALAAIHHSDSWSPRHRELYVELNKYRHLEFPLLRTPIGFLTRVTAPEPSQVPQFAAKALRQSPHDPELLLRLAAHFTRQDRPCLARLAHESASAHANPTQRAQIAFMRAHLALDAKDGLDPIGARNHLALAVALRPDFADAWSDLGAIWMQLRRGCEAVEALQRAVALRPNFFEFQINLGNAWIMCRKPDSATRARSAYLLAQDLAPLRPESACNLGILYLENRLADLPGDEGSYAKAVDYLKKCLALRGSTDSKDDAPTAHLAEAMMYLQREVDRRKNAERNAQEEAELRRIRAPVPAQSRPAVPLADGAPTPTSLIK